MKDKIILIGSLLFLLFIIVVGKYNSSSSEATTSNNTNDVVVSNEAVLKAVDNNDIDTMKKLIDKGANVDIVGEYKETPLMRALDKDHIEMAKLLIEKTKDINAKDNLGLSALYYAVYDTGFRDKVSVDKIVKLLILKGADVNITDNKNNSSSSVLEYAVLCNDLEVVKSLVESLANVNYVDEKGDSPLSLAFDKPEIKAYLISKGASENNAKQALNSAQTNNQSLNTSVQQDLQVLETHCEDGYICGTVINNTVHPYKYVEIDINLYDDAGNQVGDAMTNTTNLEANKQWKFKAVVLEKNVKSFKVIQVTGN